MTGKGTSAALAAATYLRDVLAMQWRVHMKTCGKCIVTTAAKRQYCDDGWRLVRDLQLARTRVAELQHQVEAEHPTLF